MMVIIISLLTILSSVISINTATQGKAKLDYYQMDQWERIKTATADQLIYLSTYILDLDSIDKILEQREILDKAVVTLLNLIDEEKDHSQSEREEQEEYDNYKNLLIYKNLFNNQIDGIIQLHSQGHQKEALETYKILLESSSSYYILKDKLIDKTISEEYEEILSSYGTTWSRYRLLLIYSRIVLALSVIFILFLYLFSRLRVILPLSKLDNIARSYTEKKELSTFPSPSNDEVGSLTLSIKNMIETIERDTVELKYVNRRINSIRQKVELIGRGDLSVQFDITFNKDVFDRLSLGINTMMETIQKGLSTIEHQKDEIDSILISLDEGIMTLDRYNQVSYINNTAIQLLNKKHKEDIIGLQLNNCIKLNQLQSSHPLRQYLEGNLSYEELTAGRIGQLNFNNDEEEELLVEIRWLPINREHYQKTGMLLILRDITPIIKNQREINNLRDQMMQRDKLASIGLLASGMAHEINNPIGYIKSNQRALQKDLNIIKDLFQDHNMLNQERIDLFNEIEEMLNDNHSGIQKIHNIVEDMKSFSRSGDSRDFKKENLNEIIGQTIRLAKAESKVISKIVFKETALPLISCIANQIEQVLLNIIINSLQAIQRLNTNDGNILIETGVEGEGVICIISDNGNGIPEENKAKVFDPFFTTKSPGEGTGLGLNVSFNIIKHHHGTIEVVPSVLGGASIKIWLPIQ